MDPRCPNREESLWLMHSRLHIYKESSKYLIGLSETLPLQSIAIPDLDAARCRIWYQELYDCLSKWSSWERTTALSRWTEIKGGLEELYANCPEGFKTAGQLLTTTSTLQPSIEETIDAVQATLSSTDGAESVLCLDTSAALSWIELLDQALAIINTRSRFYKTAFHTLRKLCAQQLYLPKSFYLSQSLQKTSDQPVAFGSFADVWRGRYGGCDVALKAIRTSSNADLQKIMENFCKEAVLWKHLSHPNITPFLGVNTIQFRLCMISNWMANGNITTYIRDNPDANRPVLVMDVARGLEYLHSLDIVHGDLKGPNILIDERCRACLSDFGLTGIVYGIDTVNPVSVGSVVSGSIRWMAPENLDPDSAGTGKMSALPESDIHSFAMVVWEIFTGNHPYTDYRLDAAVMHQILRGVRPPFPPEAVELGLNKDVWNLMEMCWDPRWQDRPRMPSIVSQLRHAFRQLASVKSIDTPKPQHILFDEATSIVDSDVDRDRESDPTSSNVLRQTQSTYCIPPVDFSDAAENVAHPSPPIKSRKTSSKPSLPILKIPSTPVTQMPQEVGGQSPRSSESFMESPKSINAELDDSPCPGDISGSAAETLKPNVPWGDGHISRGGSSSPESGSPWTPVTWRFPVSSGQSYSPALSDNSPLDPNCWEDVPWNQPLETGIHAFDVGVHGPSHVESKSDRPGGTAVGQEVLLPSLADIASLDFKQTSPSNKYGKVLISATASGRTVAVKQGLRHRHSTGQKDGPGLQGADFLACLKMECEILGGLDHANVVRCFGFTETSTVLTVYLESPSAGSVSRCIRTHGALDDNIVKSFTKQTLAGLEYIHGKGIVHGNLRADNLLLDADGVCKLSNFVTSRRVDEDEAVHLTGLDTHVQIEGTVFWVPRIYTLMPLEDSVRWMAPELINTEAEIQSTYSWNMHKGYGSQLDVWAVGCVVHEMWTGKQPWAGEEPDAVLAQLHQTKRGPPLPEEIGVSLLANDFRSRCFVKDPDERPTAATLRKHAYLILPSGWTFRGFD